MITYDPGNWGILFAMSIKGSVFPKALLPGSACSALSVVLHWILHSDEGRLEEFGAGDAAANVLGGFTFILGFLVVFRSQQAYSRWWEGGTLLQQLRGEWFNSFSCLVAFCNAAPEKRQDVVKFQHQMVRLFSLLYGCGLEQVATMDKNVFEIINFEGLDDESLNFLHNSHDRCEVVLQWIQRLIVESDAAGTLKIAPPILSRVFNELGNGIVNLNNARKISDFPIPFHLAQMITVMVMCHSVITPVVCAATVSTLVWSGIISFIVSFSFWSVYYIAVELEMPFGNDANDLPLTAMQKDMNASLRQMMNRRAQEVPLFDFCPEHHMSMEVASVDFKHAFSPKRRRAVVKQQAADVADLAPKASLKLAAVLPVSEEKEVGLNIPAKVRGCGLPPFPVVLHEVEDDLSSGKDDLLSNLSGREGQLPKVSGGDADGTSPPATPQTRPPSGPRPSVVSESPPNTNPPAQAMSPALQKIQQGPNGQPLCHAMPDTSPVMPQQGPSGFQLDGMGKGGWEEVPVESQHALERPISEDPRGGGHVVIRVDSHKVNDLASGEGLQAAPDHSDRGELSGEAGGSLG